MRSRHFLLVVGLFFTLVPTPGQGENYSDPYSEADAKLNQFYQRSLATLLPEYQVALREAERAWITFTQKNERAMGALQTAGFITKDQLAKICLKEELNRCDQLQTFFLKGILIDYTPLDLERADLALQRTYGSCFRNSSPADGQLLREAQRAWITYRDADADASVLAARNAGRKGFRGFAAKIQLTNMRDAQLRSIYLSRAGAEPEQPNAPGGGIRSTDDGQEVIQLKQRAQAYLKTLLAQKDAPFFGKPGTLKNIPNLPPNDAINLFELNSKFEELGRRYGSAKLIEPAFNEYAAVYLLASWDSFINQIKTGSVDRAGEILHDALIKKPKALAPDYLPLWQTVENWQPAFTKAAKDFEDHVARARTLADLGKNSDAIREYEAAFEIIENSSISQAIKKLRERALGL